MATRRERISRSLSSRGPSAHGLDPWGRPGPIPPMGTGLRRCDRNRKRLSRSFVWVGTLAAFFVLVGSARAEVGTDRSAALDEMGRGTAAFRAGDIVAATKHWSEAVRVCRQIGAPDIEAQALSRRGEAYRMEGYFRDAGSDLQAALTKAEQSGDQTLIAATSGALGNLAFMSHRSAAAEPLLKRSRDLAVRLRDPEIVAASENDLGNLYVATKRPTEAASAYEEAIRNAEAARDEALAATAGINAARLALGHDDWARAAPLLSQAVNRLDRSPPSYSRGMALISAGSAVFERPGSLPPDAQALALPGLPVGSADGGQPAQCDLVLARPRQPRPAL